MCAKQRDYVVNQNSATEKALEKLKKKNKQVFLSVVATIKKLEKNPRPQKVKHLGGKRHRVRDGEFRILYEIDDAAREVNVYDVGDRKEVYKH